MAKNSRRPMHMEQNLRESIYWPISGVFSAVVWGLWCYNRSPEPPFHSIPIHEPLVSRHVTAH